MANEKRLIEYFVIKEKNTGLYFRGKGVNRWGKYYNQASIYRMKGQAENTADWLCKNGEPVEIVQIQIIESASDAVEAADMKEFAEDVVYQFGYYCQNGGRLHITHGGLSTLEWAFDILGWENPHPVPECECQIEGCHEHATCGTPTADGYKRMCGKHCRNHCAKMDGDGNG